MKKEEKNIIIDDLAGLLAQYPTVYITDTSALTVAKTSQLRRLCFNKGVKMVVAKNKLIRVALGNRVPTQPTAKLRGVM